MLAIHNHALTHPIDMTNRQAMGIIADPVGEVNQVFACRVGLL